MSTGQKPSVSAAAEALFETKNVADIRKIEAQTRREIEDKNQQLRQLVGDSYRDLIEGTDKIIDISTKCHSILSNILSIQESFGSLAVSVTGAAGGQDDKDFVRKHQELHAVGSRVKFILDTPEAIWGYLDGQQHLEAARRLLHVHKVHEHLQAAYSADLAAKFPLMSHQWPLVLKFKQQILDIATSSLSSTAHLTSQEAADATAAIAMLEGLSSAAALQQFLAYRKQWAQQHLERALSANEQAEQEPGAVLAELAQQVQSCIAQVGELFTANRPSAVKAPSSNGSSSGSLLQQVLQEDETDVSELYFGSMDAASEGSNSPEAVAWRQTSGAICQQLTPLQRSQIEQACSAWLADVAAACNQHGSKLLQLCNSAHSLLDAEKAVQLAIAQWTVSSAAGPGSAAATAADTSAALDVQTDSDQGAAAGGISRPGSASASRLGRSGSSGAALAASAAANKGSSSPRALAGRAANEWDTTCELVLGQKLDLWQVLFHQPFLERCKDIIREALSDACASINQPLKAALQAAAQHEPEAAGQLLPGKWPSVVSHSAVADGVLLDRTYSVLGSRSTSGAWMAGPHSLAYSQSGALVGMLSLLPGALGAAEEDKDGFRSELSTIKHLFDSRLHAALQAVVLLTAAAGAAEQQPLRRSGSTPGSSLTPGSRAGSLTPAMARGNSIAAAASQSGFGAASPAAAAANAAEAACSAAGKSRAADLEQYAQQQCVELVQQLAGKLQQQLQELPAVQDGVQGAPVVEQVLVLARLCHSIATSSTMLPALLGPPDAWPAASKAGPEAAASSLGYTSNALPASLAQGVSSLGPAAAALLRMHHPGLLGPGAGGGAAAATAAQLTAIQQQLHGVACSGYSKWAAWVAASLSAALLTALKGDELLRSNATPLSWVETHVATEGGGSDMASLLDPLDPAAVGEMKFALPGSPSPAVVQMLSLACWETRRAGEHMISTDALQLLQWEVHGAALAALQQLGSSVTSSSLGGHATAAATDGEVGGITEKGVLQLLFDQRLLRDVLGGGKPLGAQAAADTAAAANGVADGSTASPAAALAARKKLVAGLEQRLQDYLDPIDWATYEPHLWTNVQQYYQRTSVLLGTLGQLQKPYADAPRTAAAGAGTDFNAVNLLPVAPRFHYLPISTPTALHGVSKQWGLSTMSSGTLAGFTGADAFAGVPANAAAAVQAGGMAGAGSLASQLASSNSQASDLAAQYIISKVGSGSGGARVSPAPPGKSAEVGGAAGVAPSHLHLSADAAASAGASALSALQARLQGSSFGAFGSMLGDRAAEVTAMAQNFGDLLPSAGLGGGLLSSFGRRDGASQPVGSSGAKK